MNIRFFPLLASVALLTGCAQANAPLWQSDLLHHHFVLRQVDGVAVAGDAMEPGIEFGERLYVSAIMCSRFSGWGELKNNTLTIAEAEITRRSCVDARRTALDEVMDDVLRSGARLSLEQQTLILRSAHHTLVYQLKDWL